MALVVPFVIGPLVARAYLGRIASAISAALIAAAPVPSAALSSSDRPSTHAPSDAAGEDHDVTLPTVSRGELGDGSRRIARRPNAEPPPIASGAPRPSVDAGASAPPAPPALDAPSRGTIVVPAAVIAKAIEKKDVGATNAVGPDGAPLGARIRGASRYRAGLRDGDVIVFASGKRTETTTVLMDVGMKALMSGATRLTGKILRGDAIWDVVLELPAR